jgi:outer membrane protein
MIEKVATSKSRIYKEALRVRAALALTAALVCGHARAADVLRAQRDISATPAGAMLPAASSCPAGPPGNPLQLAEAVERALCCNPKTSAAWANVKAQAAAVGAARAAYLPTLSANGQAVHENSTVNVQDHPTLGSAYSAGVHSTSLSLNWLLYDFGGREATLDNANALLAAARATQNATLQTVFATVAKDYYAAQAAASALTAAQGVEQMTRESMTAAQERSDRGVAPITDALQAQTQHEQALLDLTKAQEQAQTALGALASDMGLDPDAPLQVPAATEGSPPAKTFTQTATRMIELVKRWHPTVRAAQAQYEAALAKVAQTRAQGLPSLSLVAQDSLNNQPQSMGLGLPTYPATGHETYVGVQVNIRLFEGFGRQYQIDQAKAQAEQQRDALADARQQVALDVWNSYHALASATQNITNSMNLLDIAQKAQDAARQRYDTGVGNILELMNTQAALANAQQRRIQALTDWSYARVDLAAKLGRLDAGDVR